MPWPFVVLLALVGATGVAFGAGWVLWRFEERAARRRVERREEWLNERRRVGL